MAQEYDPKMSGSRAAMFLKYCLIIINYYTVECPSSAEFLQCKPLFVKGESESANG